MMNRDVAWWRGGSCPDNVSGGRGGAHVSCTVARRSLDHLSIPTEESFQS
jgi:hypothetical protein